MGVLGHDDVVALLLTVGVLLATARMLGELFARFGQPAVVGELLAGVLLGSTVLGRVWPQAFTYLFPGEGPVAISLSGLANLALVLFLLVAGLEVDLSAALRQGRAALWMGALGIAAPFALGFLAGWGWPEAFGKEPAGEPLVFALFFATALSISAMPVIAKTLMDLQIYRSDLGILVMAAAVLNDLAGWIVFAMILGLMEQGGGNPTFTVLSTLGYWALMLAGGRWAFHRLLPYLEAYSSGAGGVLTTAAVFALFGAAFTEWIGVHAIFGSFMVGVAFGDSRHLRQHVRRTLSDFVSFIFAPLFFASIALGIDFAAHFDLPLVLSVTAIACVGKFSGCLLGGRLGGLSVRASWAAAAGMNARGAMEIILGLLALRFGLIGNRLFVALVVMALLTSMVSGPLMRRILRAPAAWRVAERMSGKAFVARLSSVTREGAIRELCEAASRAWKLDVARVTEVAITRERTGTTSLGEGVAAPHARLPDLSEPRVAVGLSDAGIDFDAPDDRPVHLVFLLLTPSRDDAAQVQLLSDIALLCGRRETRTRLLAATSSTEFRALLAHEAHERRETG